MTHQTERLDPATHMDTLSLRVADLPAMVRYYTDGVGLAPLAEGGGTITLGLGARPILKLVHSPELRRPASSAAGLYHSAILFDSQADLSASLLSMFSRYPDTYTGSADHLVSEAFYFTDPEGNGLELYADRPRDQWQWDGDQVRMTTIYLDPSRFVNTHIDRDLVESGRRPELGAVLGHAHLQVGDIPTARDFYVGTLGFDQTARMGSRAIFVSAGGYHHHIGMNTWQSAGAGPRDKTLGLGSVDIAIPNRTELDRLVERLRAEGREVRDDGDRVVTLDPWRNEVRLNLVG